MRKIFPFQQQPEPSKSEPLALALVVGTFLLVFMLLLPGGRDRLSLWASLTVDALNATPSQGNWTSGRQPEALADLTPEQKRAARWISRRYRVSYRVVEEVFQAASIAGARLRLDPYLILAVVAVESGFNPIAESSVGAAGLMQVMPLVHQEKFVDHGGLDVAFDPYVNVQVGAEIIREYMDRFGSLDAALLAYVGVGPMGESEYPQKVMRMLDRIRAASRGRILA